MRELDPVPETTRDPYPRRPSAEAGGLGRPALCRRPVLPVLSRKSAQHSEDAGRPGPDRPRVGVFLGG